MRFADLLIVLNARGEVLAVDPKGLSDFARCAAVGCSQWCEPAGSKPLGEPLCYYCWNYGPGEGRRRVELFLQKHGTSGGAL